MSISGAKFVSLDSSMLGRLARDYFSKIETRRKSARMFLDLLARRGVIPFLCWHQFEELIKHGNDDTARERVAFLRALPLAAWVRARDGSTLGSVVDVFVAECEAILGMGEKPSLIKVRNAAKEKLISFGSGADAVAPYEDVWLEVRPCLWRREKEAREIVAVSRAQVADISNRTVGSCLSGALRSPRQARAILDVMRLRMANEIRTRGDKRIPNPDGIAEDFYNKVYSEGSQLWSEESSGPGAALAEFGIDLEQLDPHTKMGEVLADVEFRSKLRAVCPWFTLSAEGLRKVIRSELVPTWIIERSIANFGQLREEHKGSELNDRHLACLAPYCHLTYVDKQTMEDIRRARQNSQEFVSIMGKVERVTSHEKAAVRMNACDF